MGVLKYRDPETGEIKKVGAPITDGVDIPASDVAPEEGEWWLDTSEDGEDYKLVPATRTINGKSLENNITLSASDVGAAPVEFALNNINDEFVSSTDEDGSLGLAHLDAVLAGMPNLTAKRFAFIDKPYMANIGAGGRNASCTLIKLNSDANAVAFFVSADSYGLIWQWRRSKLGNDWQPIEWINPPLAADKEYRTTERINNTAVYKRNVNGVTQYRLAGETEWKFYADAVGALQMDLLWENASPASEFASQTITFETDFSEYDLIRVTSNYGSTESAQGSNGICDILVGKFGYLSAVQVYDSGHILQTRKVIVNNNGTISIGGNYHYRGDTNAWSVVNGRNIPYKIYGIKGIKDKREVSA
jgi:hypothetical protein